jgi:hypothetical protein
MTTVHTILQINPCVFYKINLESIFFMEIFTYTPKRLKIFTIRFKLHKNSSKIHLNF